MAEKKVSTRIQQKHDLEVNWISANNSERPFIPMVGEIIVYDCEVAADGTKLELPEGRTIPFTYERFKIGDGKTKVSELPFVTTPLVNGIEGVNSIQQIGYNAAFDPSQPGYFGNSAEVDQAMEMHYIAHPLGVNANTGDTSAVFGDSNTNGGTSALVVGSCNTNRAGGSFSIVTGTWNINGTDGYNSIVAGHSNTNIGRNSVVAGDDTQNAGYNNIVGGYDNTITSNDSGSVGMQNVVGAGNTFVAGMKNQIHAITDNAKTYGGNIVTGLLNTSEGAFGLTAGISNQNKGDACIINGMDSKVLSTGALVNGKNLETNTNGFYSINNGQNNYVNHWNSITSGLGLHSIREGAAIFGTYNDYSDDTILLAVGKGTSDTVRSNAIEVHANGDLKVANTLSANSVSIPGSIEVYAQENTLTARRSGVFGRDNNVQNGDALLVVGDGNTVISYRNATIGTGNRISTTDSLAVGNTITLGETANNSGAFGEQHALSGPKGFAAGTYNRSGSDAANTALFGNNNVSIASNSFIAGDSNIIYAEGIAATIFGTGNNAYKANAFIAGKSNIVESLGENAVAFGQGNKVQNKNAASFGSSNVVAGEDSFVAGTANILNVDAPHSAILGYNIHVGGQNTLAAGADHRVIAANALVAGQGNMVAAGHTGAVALGTGLTTNTANQVIVGKNNSTSDSLFIIGNGEDAEHKTNAFEVTNSASIILNGKEFTRHHIIPVFAGGSQAKSFYSADNLITGDDSYYGNIALGGEQNEVGFGYNSAIIGGNKNHIEAGAEYGIFAGSENNIIGNGGRSTILGGFTNKITDGYASTIVGGQGNEITNSLYSNVLGGQNNKITRANYAAVLGYGNEITGETTSGSNSGGNFVAGNNNKADGAYTVTFGTSNENYGAYNFINGMDVTITSDISQTMVNGKNITVSKHATPDYAGNYHDGSWSFANGYQNTVSHRMTLVSGSYLKSSAKYQTTLGVYNAPAEDSLLVIGNGTSEADRTNAFIVKTTGEVEAHKYAGEGVITVAEMKSFLGIA